MCGIIGIIGSMPVATLLVDALKRLEYRGYDSAGVATLVAGRIERRRAEGKLANLEARLASEPLQGTIGIGHTRWATHGRPSERNAHPIATTRVAIVHNGIIENFQELKDELVADGRHFESDTDTEVVAQLLTAYLERQLSPEEAVEATLARLRGVFALIALFGGRDDLLIGARRGSSLAVGYGDNAMYIGTDALALAPFTDRVCYLEDGDVVVVKSDACTVTHEGLPVSRIVVQTGLSGAMLGKGNNAHFMLKEMQEQPAVVGDTLRACIDMADGLVRLPPSPINWRSVTSVAMTACGTAFYACSLASYWFGRYARLPVYTEVASEFRYREPPLPNGGVAIAVSQSGETIDTLEALRYAKRVGQTVLSVVNVPHSAIARESDGVVHTLAGPEIAVASTKAFTTQLAVLALIAIAAGRARGTFTRAQEKEALASLMTAPEQLRTTLIQSSAFEALGERLAQEKVRDVLYLGRGPMSVVALEGALKLKELSYIHAEGYPGGEMKHGPIALVDGDLYSVFLMPSDAWFEKSASNLEQVLARGGKVVLLSDASGIARLGAKATVAIELPPTDALTSPLVYSVAVQLIAYYTALAKGTDIDQPRNLAKSVTVE